MQKAQLVGLSVILVVAGIIGFVGYRFGTRGNQDTTQEVQPGRPYQSVFLTNGQVYFGKVIRKTAEETLLRDIYYLQVQQPIQPPPEGQTVQPQIQLVKLGNELHKPKDEMTINRDHILFTEDLNEDGQVVQAIRRFQRGEVGAAPAAPAAETTEKKETKKEEKKTDQKTEPSTETTEEE